MASEWKFNFRQILALEPLFFALIKLAFVSVMFDLIIDSHARPNSASNSAKLEVVNPVIISLPRLKLNF